MKFETRREREQRIKRQKQSSILGMVFAIFLVLVLGIALFVSKQSLKKQNAEYEVQKAELQAQIEEQQNRSTQLDDYEKYIKTKKFVEEMAKDKFGLIYRDELVFKPK